METPNSAEPTQIYAGIHCNTEIDSSRNLITKIIATDLPQGEIPKIISDYDNYYRKLIAAGLQIPQSYGIESVNGQLKMIEEFIPGINFKSLIKNSVDPNFHHQPFHLLLNVALRSEQYRILGEKLFIDLKLENFVFYQDQLFFVDLYPAMIDDGNGFIQNYYPSIYGNRIPQHMAYNFGHLTGQITKLFALLDIESHPNFDTFKKWTLEYLYLKIPESTLKYLANQLNNRCPHQKYLYGKTQSYRDKLDLLSFLLSDNYEHIPNPPC